jgi:hypothetical protein
MSAYTGETLTARFRATDPVTGSIISDATGTAYFFAPPKDPATNPSDRGSPDHTVSMAFDTASQYYLASVPTTGWASGTWWVQFAVVGGAGGYDGWEYYSFPLSA